MEDHSVSEVGSAIQLVEKDEDMIPSPNEVYQPKQLHKQQLGVYLFGLMTVWVFSQLLCLLMCNV